MFCCSPPPRDEAAQQACWQRLKDSALSVYSSDHAHYRYDESSKVPKSEQTTFKEIANGVPGLELRLPLLFTFGYGDARLRLPEFVDLTATRHAQVYGCYPRKGTIAAGSDADIAIWDPQRSIEIKADLVHDNVGYTPYAGRRHKGWPITVRSRGTVIIKGGTLLAERGRGRFVARRASDATANLGRKVPAMAPLNAWGTPLNLCRLGINHDSPSARQDYRYSGLVRPHADARNDRLRRPSPQCDARIDRPMPAAQHTPHDRVV